MGLSGKKAVAAVAVVAAVSMTATACQTKPAAEIVGKQWQITAIFDDPNLPHGVPDGTQAPTITLGQTTYTFADSCGNGSGSLQWKGEAVEFGTPEQTRSLDCSDQAQTYSERFHKIVAGEFVYTQDNNGLRMREMKDTKPGEDRRGWTATTSGYTEGR